MKIDRAVVFTNIENISCFASRNGRVSLEQSIKSLMIVRSAAANSHVETFINDRAQATRSLYINSPMYAAALHMQAYRGRCIIYMSAFDIIAKILAAISSLACLFVNVRLQTYTRYTYTLQGRRVPCDSVKTPGTLPYTQCNTS